MADGYLDALAERLDAAKGSLVVAFETLEQHPRDVEIALSELRHVVIDLYRAESYLALARREAEQIAPANIVELVTPAGGRP